MTKIITQGKNGKEIDLTPVIELKSRLEKAIMDRKTWKDRTHIDKILDIQKDSEKLNSDQQKYFTYYLMGKMGNFYDLFLGAIGNPTKIKEYQKLLGLAKKPN